MLVPSLGLLTAPAVVQAQGTREGEGEGEAHAHGAVSTMQLSSRTLRATNAADDTLLPPDADHALARLNASPRHGQWVMIPRGKGDSLRAWIVYPERSTRAPVIVVIHEIFGMSTWIRAVTDQLAASGYIAIAPDLLTGQQLPGAPDSVPIQAAIAAVSKLNAADVQRDVNATATYAMALPAALPRYGIVGFCWGGSVSFANAVHGLPSLAASVVYYGTPPSDLAAVHAPVLGLYGANDARVVMTIAPADSAMHALGRTYVHHVYDGATHGFLRAQQGGTNGANMAATSAAWPATIGWLRKYLDR